MVLFLWVWYQNPDPDYLCRVNIEQDGEMKTDFSTDKAI